MSGPPIAAAHAARFGVASLFLLAGLNKILNADAVIAMMAEAGIAPTWIFYPATVALELGAGALVALGGWRAAPAALCLAAFTIATNLFFHRFWELEGDLARLELSLFFKNVAVASALCYVAVVEWTGRGDGNERADA